LIERKDILGLSLRKKLRRCEIEMGEMLRYRVVVVKWAVVAMTAEGTVWAVVLMLMTVIMVRAVASMGRRRSHSRLEQ